MTVEIPTKEPSVCYAGDSVAWTKTLSDYPASDGYTLYYAFRSHGLSEIDITATTNADGLSYDIEVDPILTALWDAGVYDWVSYVETSLGVRYTAESGKIIIKPAMYAESGTDYDRRTPWKRILDNLETAFEAISTKGFSSISSEGRMWTKERLPDLIVAINHARVQVSNEETADRIAQGLGSKRKIRVRFI